LKAGRLREQLGSDPSLAGLAKYIAQTRPHLFSPTVVFVLPATAVSIAATVAVIERVIALPMHQARALSRPPAISILHPRRRFCAGGGGALGRWQRCAAAIRSIGT
jgi:hypothetical protein